jgi:hypothetical protein
MKEIKWIGEGSGIFYSSIFYVYHFLLTEGKQPTPSTNTSQQANNHAAEGNPRVA